MYEKEDPSQGILLFFVRGGVSSWEEKDNKMRVAFFFAAFESESPSLETEKKKKTLSPFYLFFISV